nr:uncharacterized protein LOC109164871 [Ipomoea batatas]
MSSQRLRSHSLQAGYNGSEGDVESDGQSNDCSDSDYEMDGNTQNLDDFEFDQNVDSIVELCCPPLPLNSLMMLITMLASKVPTAAPRSAYCGATHSMDMAVLPSFTAAPRLIPSTAAIATIDKNETTSPNPILDLVLK